MASSVITDSFEYLVEEANVFAPRHATEPKGIYARCVEDTAQALLPMSNIQPKSVRNIASATPTQEQLFRHDKFIVFDLDPLKGCGECDSFTEEEQVFGSAGKLPLLALILGVRYYPGGDFIGDLQLVMNAQGSGQKPIRAGSHCTITLTTEDRLHVVRHQPYLCDDYGRETPLEALAFVEYLHGLTPAIGDERADHDEGSLELLGFPGAAEFVTACLPRLPLYIRQLTSRLQCTHTD